MVNLFLEYEDGTTTHYHGTIPVTIGRAAECDLRIRAWRVGKHHATLHRRSGGLYIDDQGALAGTYVNNKRIAEYGPLTVEDEIIIGPCRIRLCNTEEPSVPQANMEVATDATSGYPPYSVTEPLRVRGSSSVHAGYHERAAHRSRLHGALLEALNLRRREIEALSDDDLRNEANDILVELIEDDSGFPKSLDHELLRKEVLDEAVGLGPLEPLLADPAITEIMVNRHDEIFVESGGLLHRHDAAFSSEQAVLGAIERIVSPLGRRIDESSPMVDARLRDGSRVNAVIHPVALKGPSITIRKFPARRLGMRDLLQAGAMDNHMSRFLQACVMTRKNIVVSGGTGSGKTTLLNILSNCIPEGERIVTIEDAAELQLAHSHLVSLESRPVNLEGKGAITIRDLVRNALRMRPDRIVVGECRGGEAFDMLAAMNTGHEGSLTTLHANSPRDALGRLETMILMAGMDLPLAAVREHVSSGIDFIVQQARLSSGLRLITSITQITGQEAGRIQLQELFRYCPGPPPHYQGCGLLPEGMAIQDSGLDVSMFSQQSPVSPAAVDWRSQPSPAEQAF